MEVVDALIVTLGLDKSNFDAGNKAARDDLNATADSTKKGADEADKAAKNAETARKKQADAEAKRQKDLDAHLRGITAQLGKMRDMAVAAFAVLTASKGLSEFIKNNTAAGTSIGLVAQNLRMGVAELSTWQNAVRLANGGVGDMRTSLQALQDIGEEFKATGASSKTAALSMFHMGSGDFEDINQAGLKLHTEAMRVARETNRATALHWLKEMGQDEAASNLLLSPDFGKNMGDGAKTRMTQKDADIAADVARNNELAEQAMKRFGTDIYDLVGPGLVWIDKKIVDIVTFLDKKLPELEALAKEHPYEFIVGTTFAMVSILKFGNFVKTWLIEYLFGSIFKKAVASAFVDAGVAATTAGNTVAAAGVAAGAAWTTFAGIISTVVLPLLAGLAAGEAMQKLHDILGMGGKDWAPQGGGPASGVPAVHLGTPAEEQAAARAKGYAPAIGDSDYVATPAVPAGPRVPAKPDTSGPPQNVLPDPFAKRQGMLPGFLPMAYHPDDDGADDWASQKHIARFWEQFGIGLVMWLAAQMSDPDTAFGKMFKTSYEVAPGGYRSGSAGGGGGGDAHVDYGETMPGDPEGPGGIFKDLETKYNLPPGTLDQLWRIESGRGKNHGSSSAGARGDFQFMPNTAKQYHVDVNDFGSSARGAAELMRDNLRYFHRDRDKAVAAYNAGAGRVDQAVRAGGAGWLDHLPGETRNYVPNFNRGMVAADRYAQSHPASAATTSTATTHIGTIVVHTQAKDAPGIARDLGSAIDRRQKAVLVQTGLT